MDALVVCAIVIAWGTGAVWAVRKARARGVPEWQIFAGVLLLGPLCPLIALLGQARP